MCHNKGVIVSSWSILLWTGYSGVRPKLVITWLWWSVKRSERILIIDKGSARQESECLKRVKLTKSYALLISCESNQMSLWLQVASSIRLLRIWIGIEVLLLGRAT